MTRESVLTIHVVLGTLGLLLGPAVLIAGGGLRRAAARGYQLALAGVAVSALVLAATAFSRLWWLIPVAAATEAAALLGLLAWRRRRPGWPTACAHLLGGSYVALVTGVLIASTGSPVFWVLPAVVAQWPIAIAKRRLSAIDASRAQAMIRLADVEVLRRQPPDRAGDGLGWLPYRHGTDHLPRP